MRLNFKKVKFRDAATRTILIRELEKMTDELHAQARVYNPGLVATAHREAADWLWMIKDGLKYP